MPKQQLSFAVGDNEAAIRSSVWTIKASKDDVYVYSRGEAGVFKASLHGERNGQRVCFVGMTEEAVSKHGLPRNWPAPGRGLNRWLRAPSTMHGTEFAYAITFPEPFLAAPHQPQAKIEALVQPPPPGQRAEVFLAYSLVRPDQMGLPAEATLLGTLSLTSGEFVYVVAHLQPFNESSLDYLRSGGTTEGVGSSNFRLDSSSRLTLRWDAGGEGYGKAIEVGGPRLWDLIGPAEDQVGES